MTAITLDLPFIPLCEHLLLIFLLVREVRRKIYPVIASNVKLAFPEIARFFDVMQKDLEKLYPIVDGAKAATGRPPLCHHFQFRFLVFYFLSGFPSLFDAREFINSSIEWQDILHMPVKTYHGSTLSRFLERVGEETYQHIESCLIRLLLKHRLVTLKTVIIDSFPVISHLNTQKCLKHFSLDLQTFTSLFQQLDFSSIIPSLPAKRWRKIKPETYLKIFMFQFLWGYLSSTHLFKVFKKKPAIQLVLTGIDALPRYNTYCKFIKELKSSRNWPAVKFLLEIMISGNAAGKPVYPGWEHLQGLMDNQHQLKDPGSRLNYCPSKNLTYFGRAGGLFVDGGSELPLSGWVQSGARIGNEEFRELMELATSTFPEHVKVDKVVGDGEFDTDTNQESCQEILGAKLVRPVDQGKTMNRRLPEVFFKLRLGVERVIARLAKLNGMQRPPVLGEKRVRSYVHGGIITLQLLALYSAQSGQRSKCRSIKWMRRKQAV
jgi:hypothetical protein